MCKQLYNIFPDSEKGDKKAGAGETDLSPEQFKAHTAEVVAQLLKDGVFMRNGNDSEVCYHLPLLFSSRHPIRLLGHTNLVSPSNSSSL